MLSAIDLMSRSLDFTRGADGFPVAVQNVKRPQGTGAAGVVMVSEFVLPDVSVGG
jgi:hypothetical protein